MKKSEVVTLIYNTIADNHHLQYGEFKELASDILNAIEDNNCILPPKFYDREEDNFMSVEDVIDCGNLCGEFKWEDE